MKKYHRTGETEPDNATKGINTYLKYGNKY
jgi:hypothetical protein